jgi:hypothetical protein
MGALDAHRQFLSSLTFDRQKGLIPTPFYPTFSDFVTASAEEKQRITLHISQIYPKFAKISQVYEREIKFAVEPFLTAKLTFSGFLKIANFAGSILI